MHLRGNVLAVFCIISIFWANNYVNLKGEEKQYNTDPYGFAASQIVLNKIVMLGENGALDHYNLFPHITFLNVIKSWKNTVQKENLHNKTLTLVIERSPSAVKLVQKIIDENDLNPFLETESLVYSLEDLYLFSKLGELKKEIESTGNHLKIVGFEIDERYDNEWFFKKSNEERSNFTGIERDSLLYKDMSSYIKSNPDENILINYGHAHLSDEYFHRTFPPDVYGKGHCFAYYLRRDLKEKFVTIDQNLVYDSFFENRNDLSYVKKKNFLLEKGDTILINQLGYRNLFADFLIVKHDGLVGPHFIRNVFSRNTLLRNSNMLLEFDKYSRKYNKSLTLQPKENQNPLVARLLQSMNLITGRNFKSIPEYTAYLDSTKSEFYHNRISEELFSKELYGYLKNNPENNNFRFMLYCIGMVPNIYFSVGVPLVETWENDLWKNAQVHMNYFDYVGLLWLGTDEEKEKAWEFLAGYTKENYSDAPQYLEWYYKNKYNYNFDM
ncbi:MAG: hypothetical protein ACM3S2_04315 [Ignavibacteriales bacterium]